MSFYVSTATFFFAPLWRMGPRCSSAETQVCHRSYIIAARSRWPIRIIIFEMQWNLSKIHWPNFCVQNRQVVSLYRLNWQRIPILRLYLKFGLFRILVYSGFDIDKFLCTCTCTQYHYWFYRYSVYSVHIDSP